MKTTERFFKALWGTATRLLAGTGLRLLIALAVAGTSISGVRAWGEIKLIAPDGVGEDAFGYRVAIAGDTMVVGSINDGDKGYQSGSAYVFERNLGGVDNWGLVKKLIGSGVAAYHHFGSSVAISGDTIVVGAWGFDHTPYRISGAAYVFERNLGGVDNWGEVKKLTGSDVTPDHRFGWHVDVSGDTIVVGAARDTDNGSCSGAVYVFARNHGGANNWGEVKKLTASDGAPSDYFGYSLAIAGDTMFVGAVGDYHNNQPSAGSVYVLERNLGGVDNWGELKKLSASDGAAYDSFGTPVAISGDSIVVGAMKDDDNGQDSGSAYIFERNQGGVDNWGELKKLTASDGAGIAYFGFAAAIAGDAILVGAYYHNESTGSAYVFARNQGGADNWGEVKKLNASDGEPVDWFGFSVAIAGDTTVIGAPRDDDKGPQSGSVYVYSLNQPPVADADGPYSVPEGGSVGLSGSGSDPDGDPLTYAWDLDGDSIFETEGQNASFSAAERDGPSSQAVTLQVCDDKNACDTSSTAVDIANLAPTVGEIAVPVTPVEVSLPIEASAAFSDAGLSDTHTATWDWGDNTVDTIDPATSPVTAHHTYTEPGVYTVRLTVADDDNGSGQSLFQYVVVYAPEGGFVTGGGWIDSPTGAYIPAPSLTGKATFGFVSKYKKGASVPMGQTEFHFHVADMNFHSTGYQWLVIAGAQAKFKGWGTINGSGDYAFMLSAVDGQVSGGGGIDKFRIKIWDQATEEVIYDNQMGDADDAEAADAIEGGRIIIHSG